MTGFENIKQVYFLGIGGIGMSALARYFRHAGLDVSGYDRTETALTRELASGGISVHYNDMPEMVASMLKKEETLVVLTPAVPVDMGERSFLEKNGFMIRKRSEVLGMISSRFKVCAVSGTHGKTTVSTMLAHIFNCSSLGCTAFLGGISKNYGTNLLLSSTSEWLVAEADEFDRSFLRLFPDLAVVTAMDADHLDIYGNHEAVVDAFNVFVSQVKPGGKVVVKKGLPVDPDRCTHATLYSYALDAKDADFHAENIVLDGESYHFDLVYPEGRIADIKLVYPALVNVENAVAASALALLSGTGKDAVVRAMASYSGVKRRFDIRYRDENYLLIDDYAHHPGELKATIESVKAMFPGRKVTGIFQPHLYSRTADFAAGFARELSKLDEVILLDIYPAREKPIPGVSSALIFNQLTNQERRLISKSDLPGVTTDLKPGVVLMMGAGDIDMMVEPVKEMLIKNKNG